MAGIRIAVSRQKGERLAVVTTLDAAATSSAAKAATLYSYIDGSGFYRNPVDPAWRSRMNVPFMIGSGSAADLALDPGVRYQGL